MIQAQKNILSIAALFISSFCFAQEGDKLVQTNLVSPSSNAKAVEYYNKASDFFKQKDYRNSIKYNKLAIAEDSNYVDAMDNLGLSFRKLNMLDSAEYYYLYSLKKNPRNTNPIQNLAVVAELRKDYDKATLYYSSITMMEPGNPEGYFGLARMQFLSGKPEDAFVTAQKAEELYKRDKSPYIGDCYYILCIIAYELDKKDVARKYMQLVKSAGMQVDAELEKALQ